MSDTKKTVLIIDPDIKVKWGQISEEDRNIIIAENIRLLVLDSQERTKAINNIKTWVTLFGVLLIIAIILQTCSILT